MKSLLKRYLAIVFSSLNKTFNEYKKIFTVMVIICAVGTFVLIQFDKAATEYMKSHRNENHLKIMKAISKHGGFHGVAAYCFLILSVGVMLKNKQLRNAAIAGILAASFAGITANLIKFPLGRPRPKTVIFDKVPHRLHGPSFNNRYHSFPSAHTACAFGAAEAISIAAPFLALPSLLFASIIAFSRFYTLNHYPSDIFFAIFIGLFFAVICDRLVRDILKNSGKNSS